jgi:[ribosomal protein S18]-alanine N-acetyltransferase
MDAKTRGLAKKPQGYADCAWPCATGRSQEKRVIGLAAMTDVAIRAYEARDFAALHRLDQRCFVPGIAYSKWSLQYFLSQPQADCLLAEEGNKIVGFILAEENPPLAHIITLDVAPEKRRSGLGSALLNAMEKNFRYHEVRSVLLETSVDNESGIAFWEHHGYRTEAVLKRYYLQRIDAYEMRKRLR